jgi:WD40 repeat protein
VKSESEQNFKYHAFISYRHADNKEDGRRWATWLHQALETYQVPDELAGTVNGRGDVIPDRIFPIFRDEEELPADADLAGVITRALDDTNFLIVICSPNAVASTYVAEEIDYFKRLGRSGKIIAAMIAGEPNTSIDKSKLLAGFSAEDECFPRPLQYVYDEDGPTDKLAEPVAANFRIIEDGESKEGWTNPESYRQYLLGQGVLTSVEVKSTVKNYERQQQLMLLKIIAGVIGVALGELTKRDKAYQIALEKEKAKKLRRWLTGVALLSLIAMGSGVFAWQKRNEAERLLLDSRHNFGLVLNERANNSVSDKRFGEAAFYSASLAGLVKPGAIAVQNKLRWQEMLSRPIAALTFPHRRETERSHNFSTSSLSPDGRTLVSGSKFGAIRLWDVTTGELKMSLAGHKDIVRKVVYSRDGSLIASGSRDNTIGLWDSVTGKLKRVLKGHSDSITSIAFSPDGKKLVSGSWDKSVRLWDVEKGSLLFKANGHNDDITCIAFSPNGRLIASGSNDKTVRLWNAGSGRLLKILRQHKGAINELAFSPDGLTLASGASDKLVHLWDSASGSLKSSLIGHTSYVKGMSFSHDGKLLATGSGDKTIRLWDLSAGVIAAVLTGHSQSINSVSFSVDGTTLVSSGGQTIFWDLSIPLKIKLVAEGSDKKAARNSRDTKRNFTSVAYSIAGDVLASGNGDGEIVFWNTLTSAIVAKFKAHDKLVEEITFSPDGKILASASQDKTVRLWRYSDKSLLATLKGHGEWVKDIAFHPSGELIASASNDATVRLWDVATGVLKATLKGHQKEVFAIAFSPDGLTLASGSGDHSIRLWDVSTGKLRDVLNGHSDQVTSLVYSLDGSTLVSGSGDGSIRLWDSKKAEQISTLSQREHIVTSLGLSKDGLVLASGGSDKTVLLWELNKGMLIGTMAEHTHWIDDLAFSPNRSALATASPGEALIYSKHALRLKNDAFKNRLAATQIENLHYQLLLDKVVVNSIVAKKAAVFDGILTASWSLHHPFYWLPLAEKGDPEAMLQLGIIYDGLGNRDSSAYWYQKAGAAGHPEAI